MRILIVLVAAVMPALSYGGSVSAILLPGTVEDHYGKPEKSDALAPQDALRALDPINVGVGSQKQGENMVPVNRQGVFTDFGEYCSYAFPVVFDGPMPNQKIRLNAYMVRPDKKTRYILFPIATAFNEKELRLETLFPTEESTIKGNVISNIVIVPEGTKFLLLHTHPKYLTVDMETGGVRSSEEVLTGIGALGGVVGGMFAGVLFNSQVQRGKVTIAPVGIVEVMRYDSKQ